MTPAPNPAEKMTDAGSRLEKAVVDIIETLHARPDIMRLCGFHENAQIRELCEAANAYNYTRATLYLGPVAPYYASPAGEVTTQMVDAAVASFDLTCPIGLSSVMSKDMARMVLAAVIDAALHADRATLSRAQPSDAGSRGAEAVRDALSDLQRDANAAISRLVADGEWPLLRDGHAQDLSALIGSERRARTALALPPSAEPAVADGAHFALIDVLACAGNAVMAVENARDAGASWDRAYTKIATLKDAVARARDLMPDDDATPPASEPAR